MLAFVLVICAVVGVAVVVPLDPVLNQLRISIIVQLPAGIVVQVDETPSIKYVKVIADGKA
jgi:hypothetical protein